MLDPAMLPQQKLMVGFSMVISANVSRLSHVLVPRTISLLLGLIGLFHPDATLPARRIIKKRVHSLSDLVRTEKNMNIARLKTLLAFGFTFCMLLAASAPLDAQGVPGVSDNEVRIGSCSALEGPSHFLGVETVAGAKAYFNMVNEAGGVHGRKLQLVAYDDSYDPAKAQACFDRLTDQRVFVLGFSSALPLQSSICRWRKERRFRSLVFSLAPRVFTLRSTTG